MLNQLIESRDQIQEKKKLGGFMLSTSIFVFTLLLTGLIYSLFSHTVVLGADNLEISTLIAPVQMEIKPQPIDEPEPQKSEKPAANESKLPQRQANIQRIDETPVEVPKNISVTPSNQKARPNSRFLIGARDIDPDNDGGSIRGRNPGNNNSTGIKPNPTPAVVKDETIEVPPPPIIKRTPEKIPPMISGGVVNGKAINLVKPVYSAAAKNMGVKGEVRVQVTIDENGNVISANAVSGHALLRNSAVSAARSSKFTPTTLSQQKVKVTGFIIYNFS